jgi:alpha-ketoglutarate-dependent taurine dioxygenase
MTVGTSGPARSFKKRSLTAHSVDRLVRVTSTVVDPGRGLLRLVETGQPGLDLAAWIAANARDVEDALLENGAVLFRGFDVPTAEHFSRAVSAVSPNLLDYVDRAAPRREVAHRVFTSTEFAADQWIPLHHEMSYSHSLPLRVFFFCDIRPEDGGRTPLASERRVTARIDPAVKERFAAGVTYVRNYGPEIDLSWQDAFQTDDPAAVEAHCRATRTQWTWLDADHLRTRQVRPAFVTHPRTGERLWCNHAHMFHVTNMDRSLSEMLLASLGEEGLPRNAYYADGSRIEADVLDHIRQVYAEETVSFDWAAGDVLAVDNLLTVHGREPFAGRRSILVAMADLLDREGT